jgi:DNA-binding XRE family transcriptional regulator
MSAWARETDRECNQLMNVVPWCRSIYVHHGYHARVTRREHARLEAKLFGLAVRKRREAQGLSQQQLADSAGVSLRYIGALEAGDNSPSLTAIFQLCDALRISPAELLEEPWRQHR